MGDGMSDSDAHRDALREENKRREEQRLAALRADRYTVGAAMMFHKPVEYVTPEERAQYAAAFDASWKLLPRVEMPQMTANDYQKLALRTETTPRFVASGDPAGPEAARQARLLHGAIGICTEVGELQDQIKKHLIYGKALDDVNVMEECGDVLWYIALALDASGYTMEQAMERNIAKLQKRFPDKFDPERALNRDEKAERAALEGQ